jgi:hypothetical protein
MYMYFTLPPASTNNALSQFITYTLTAAAPN